MKVIRDTLTRIAEEGIDKKAVKAGINYYEFRFREADFSSYPKGLMYGLDILSSWLYDDEKPFCEVQLLEGFEFLKKAAEEGYFEELIRKYLLDNTHGSVITLVPSKGLAARKEKALEEKLHALPLTNANARKFSRFFLAGATTCEVDKQGRILIPAVLREFAGLEKDVVLAGAGNRIEVWSSEKWAAANDDENIEEICDMEGLGI